MSVPLVLLLGLLLAGCNDHRGRSVSEYEKVLEIGYTGQTPIRGGIHVYLHKSVMDPASPGGFRPRTLSREAARTYCLEWYRALAPKRGAIVYLGPPGDRYPGFPRADLGWSVSQDVNRTGVGEVRMSVGQDYSCRGLYRALWWSSPEGQQRFQVEAAVILDDTWIWQQIMAARP